MHDYYKEKTFDEEWYPGDTVQAAIGQSFNLFTPVQIAFNLVYLPLELYLITLGLILIPTILMEITKAVGLIKHRK